MTTIEIDHNVEENIVRASLMESMESLSLFITNILNTNGIGDRTREDLINEVDTLAALQTVCKFYTRYTDWHLIDAFDVDIDAVRKKLKE